MVSKLQKKLNDFLSENLGQTEANQRLVSVVKAIAESVKQVAVMVEQAPLAGQLGKRDNQNVQGEQQATLDLLTNDCFVKNLQACDAIAGMVSEELDEAILLSKDASKPNYLAVFDPLDGSSNIEVNVAVGSIFSVLKAPVGRATQTADFLQKGSEQVFAGYAIYGPSLVLVMACSVLLWIELQTNLCSRKQTCACQRIPKSSLLTPVMHAFGSRRFSNISRNAKLALQAFAVKILICAG
jgi:fructose-1,6-bisphosphatase